MKLPQLCQELQALGDVKLVVTAGAKHFISHDWRSSLPTLADVSAVDCTQKSDHNITDLNEFSSTTTPTLLLTPLHAKKMLWSGLQEEQEWHMWQQVGDPVLHIDLRRSVKTE